VTPEVSQVIREKVTGLQCGGLTIEAQDVELRPRVSAHVPPPPPAHVKDMSEYTEFAILTGYLSE
jgi:hypothetical protein